MDGEIKTYESARFHDVANKIAGWNTEQRDVLVFQSEGRVSNINMRHVKWWDMIENN